LDTPSYTKNVVRKTYYRCFRCSTKISSLNMCVNDLSYKTIGWLYYNFKADYIKEFRSNIQSQL